MDGPLRRNFIPARSASKGRGPNLVRERAITVRSLCTIASAVGWYLTLRAGMGGVRITNTSGVRTQSSSPQSLSCQHIFDHMSVHVGEAPLSAVVIKSELLVM